MKLDVHLVCFLLVVHFVFLIVLAEQHSCVDNSNCKSTNGTICNGQGVCDCGVCQCTGLHSGPTCEECPTCAAPCQIFKGCVGCKIFGTGPVSVMDCISQCDYFANYVQVENEEFDEMSGLDKYLCNYFNAELCMESFRIGNMSNGFRDIYVRTDIDCTKYVFTDQPAVKETARQKDTETNMNAYQQTVEDNNTHGGIGTMNVPEYEYGDEESDLSGSSSDHAVTNTVSVVLFATIVSFGLSLNMATENLNFWGI